VLSSYAKSHPEKVRECVGVKEFVLILSEFMVQYAKLESSITIDTESPQGESKTRSIKCQASDLELVSDYVYGIIFELLASETSSCDLSPLLNYVSYHADCISTSHISNNKAHIMEVRKGGTILLFLLQIRPRITGLYESFAQCCGSIQSGIAWLLSCMINTPDDEIRSLGLRCVASYLDATSKGPDSPLALTTASHLSDTEAVKSGEASSSVSRARSRVALIAKGIASIGPSARSIILAPSKITARVALKYIWNLLRSTRLQLGDNTRSALLFWIMDDNGILSSSLSSLNYVRSHLVISQGEGLHGPALSYTWSHRILQETGNVVGRSLHNTTAIETVLRLIRYLKSDDQDQWLKDLLGLSSAGRRSVSLIASISDWQPCLFHLISETLEELHISQDCNHQGTMDFLDNNDDSDNKNATVSSAGSAANRDQPGPMKRLDRCLELYSALLGHIVREGGEQVRAIGEMIHLMIKALSHSILRLWQPLRLQRRCNAYV
jgi:hypothetical protein